MAPFDPLQLLKLLSPLLSLEGGIKSADEVPRLSSLMKKFSKKLVSRCVYCNVLKATKQDVLNVFLDLEGWMTINTWLVDAKENKNDAFLEELLSLCKELPMTVNRLKQNNTAKLVKTLTKSENANIKRVSYKLVDSWMKLIKGVAPNNTSADKPSNEKVKKKVKKETEEGGGGSGKHHEKEEKKASPVRMSPPKAPVYEYQDDVEYEPEPRVIEKVKPKESRTKVKTLPTKFRSTGLIEEAILPKSLAKKPVIPTGDRDVRDVIAAATKKRLSTSTLPAYPEKKVKPASLITPASESNGPGIKLILPKPRPAHILHESAGFMDALDAAPLQPMRKKKTRKAPASPTTPPATATPPKLQFYKDTLELGEGKPKTEEPSPEVQSAEVKKSPDRKTTPEPPEQEEPAAPAGPVLRRSLRGKKKLEDEQKKLEEEQKKLEEEKKKMMEEDDEATEEEDYKEEAEGDGDDSEATQEGDEVPMDVDDKAAIVNTGDNQETPEPEEMESENEPKKVKSILMLTRRRDRKKSVRWVEDDNLKQFFFFEMDENERENVSNSGNFGDLKSLEMKRERIAFQSARRRTSDNMCEGMPWRHPWLIDIPPPLIEPGCNSKEKELQMHKQKTTLEEIYFSREMLPETPHEPDPDPLGPAPHEPILIPGEDLTNPGVVMDYSTMDLPIPNSSLPSVLTNLMMSIAPPFGNNEEDFPQMNRIKEQGMEGLAPSQMPYMDEMPMQQQQQRMHQDQFQQMMMQQPQQQQQQSPQQMQPPQQQQQQQQQQQHMQGPQMMGQKNMQMWGGPGSGSGPGGNQPGPQNWSGPMQDSMGMYGGNGPQDDMMGCGGPQQMGFDGPPPHQEMFQGHQQGMRPRGGGQYMMGGGGGGGGRHQRPSRGQNRGNMWRAPRTRCKHFMLGTCRFGANCNFLHPGVNGPPM